MEKNLKTIFDERKRLSRKLDETYINIIENINKRTKELEDMQKVFQNDFLKTCAMDISGETIRTFFDTGDYNITVDQLYNRIINFTYEDKIDPLSNTLEMNRKNIYNLANSKESQENLKREIGEPEKLFNKETVVDENGKEKKGKYEDNSLIEKKKKEYRKEHPNDEIGIAEKTDVDHSQPLATAKVYSKYLVEGGKEKIKEFYNSSDNFQMLGKTANQCKNSAVVYLKNEKGEYIDKEGNILKNQSKLDGRVDITNTATVKQRTEAVIDNIKGGKNRDPKTTQKLKDEGILDENGEVKPEVKRKIEENLEKSYNKEGKVILKNTDKGKVAKDAGKETFRQMGKIISGQLIYYLVPPVIYEIKEGIKNNNDGDSILEKLKNSSERIIEYVSSKLDKILSNIFFNGFKKFIKNFFSIIIEIVKGVFKKILKLAKELIIVTIDAIKILFDGSKSFAEKMDAILQLVGGLFVNLAIGILFEYISKQFFIPEWALLPLEMIVRVVLSNFAMLALKKLDIFGVNRKLKVEKIKAIFEEEEKNKDLIIQREIDNVNSNNKLLFQELQEELFNINKKIEENNMFNQSIKEELKRSFEIFGKNITLNNKLKNILGEV
ncbi:hypothetical protein [Fusobacterium nucleatum]|jgi:hypothetical protein|uniref:hypothetical protein n=1 Tax=Fusobacterium nucleatum TaxID=851 RepID=UPI00309FFA71